MLNEIEELFKGAKKDLEGYKEKKQRAKEDFTKELIKL